MMIHSRQLNTARHGVEIWFFCWPEKLQRRMNFELFTRHHLARIQLTQIYLDIRGYNICRELGSLFDDIQICSCEVRCQRSYIKLHGI
uniref:Uncharacterized protein n=1 Tax=Kalanchoe fedtschenkoi TaxID=63787 RepID=A0A7N0VHB8_KALFE